MLPKKAVLVVDDDDAICQLVREGLASGERYVCQEASNADRALVKLDEQDFDIALLDIKLPGMSGLELLRTMRKRRPMPAVIMITGVRELDTAIAAMKMGALDYIVKPFTISTLEASIRSVSSTKQRHPDRDKLWARESASRESATEPTCIMNSLAHSVDMEIDYLDLHSRRVIEKTVERARMLGIPRSEIDRWAKARARVCFLKEERLRATLSKLEKHPAARKIFGSSPLPRLLNAKRTLLKEKL